MIGLNLFLKYVKHFYHYMRDGGASYITVSYVTPSEQFKGKKVLVTGGSSGLGLAIAKAFAAEKADVLICARKQTNIDSAIEEIGLANVKGMVWDIADVKSINSNMTKALALMGKIDVFINCAGVSSFKGGMSTEEMYDYIVDINTKGLYFMCKAEGDYLVREKIQGKIINITSKAGELKQADPYTLSKWGANSITQGFARKLALHHINMNGIAPGCVPTNITAELQSHIDTDNMFRQEHNTHRFTTPEEIAYVALFLASDSAKNIVGQIIAVDGGIYI